MGRFPVFEENNPLNSGSPVQAVNPGDARIRGDSLASFGQDLAKVGTVLADVQAEKASNDAKLAAEQSLVEAEHEAKDDGSDLQALATSKYNQKVSAIKADLDPLAMGRAAPMLGRIDTEVQSESLKAKVNLQITNIKRISDNNDNVMSGNIMNNPALAAGYIDDAHKRFETQIGDSVPSYIAGGLRQKTMTSAAASYVEGMLVKGRGDISYLGKLNKELGAQEQSTIVHMSKEEAGAYGLDSRKDLQFKYDYPDDSRVDKNMSTVLAQIPDNVRLAALNKIQAAFAAHTKTKISYINKYLGAMEDNTDRGVPNDQSAVANAEQMVRAAPTELKDQYAGRLDSIKAMEAISHKSITEGFASAAAYVDGLEPSNPKDPLSVKGTNDFKIKAKAVLEKIEKSKIDDPAQFSIDHSGEEWGIKDAVNAAKDGDPQAVQSANTKMEAFQKHQGIPISHITNAAASSEGIGIMSAAKIGPEAVQQRVSDLKQKYGDDLPGVMADIQRNGKDRDLPKTVSLLGVFSDPQAQARVADNIAKAPMIREEFKKSEQNYKDLNAQMIAKENSFSSSFFGTPALRYNSAIQAMKAEVEITAMRDSNETGKSITTAVKDAYKSVIDDNYTFVPVGYNNVFIPKNDKYNPKIISKALRDNNPVDTLQKNANTLFSTVAEQLAAAPGGKDNFFGIDKVKGYDSDTITNAQLLHFRQNARIVNTEDQSGVQLVIQEPNGTLKPLMGKDGKPLMKSFKELSRYNSEQGGFYPSVEPAAPLSKRNQYKETRVIPKDTSNPKQVDSLINEIQARKIKGETDESILKDFKVRGLSEDDFYDNAAAEE